MRKVRIGNDINVRWEVKTDGKAVSLEGKALKLYVRSAYRKEEITTFTVEGCVVSFTYPASMQRMTGARAVILEDATEGAPRRTVCADQAFTLVAHSCEENDDDVEFEDFMVSLQSNVLIGKPGLSAYEVWLSEGNTGTLEDWYAFLRKPATDIAADVAEAEAERKAAETARQEAEEGRITSEQERTTAETARDKAEQARQGDENLRKTAEENRVSAETDRNDAEQRRTANEKSRETAEQMRKTNEADRIRDEKEREAAETSRKATEKLRDTAENDRDDAEQERRQHEDARADAEGKRDTAETLRKQAETGRNNAEQERTTAEQTRKDSEASRVTAEGERTTAEQTRQENETARVTAETERGKKETERITAETERKSAEQERKSAEQKRKSAEQERKTAETGREDAEAGRVLAETSRQSAEAKREQAAKDNKAANDAAVAAAFAAAAAADTATGEANTAATNADMATANANAAANGASKVNAVMGDDHVLTVTDRTGAVKTADLGDVSDVARLKRSLGPYSERPDIVLTAKETNVAVSSEGVKVSKPGWAMADFTAELGNEYLFKPGATDGNVCVFAEYIDKIERRAIEYTYTYDEKGRIATAKATHDGKTHSYTYAYDADAATGESCVITDDQTGQTVDYLPATFQTTVGSYQPMTLLNADAELPEDGYCRFVSNFQSRSAIKVVVSYKVDVADLTMKVVRDGMTASMCTQLSKINQKVDENKALAESLRKKMSLFGDAFAGFARVSGDGDPKPSDEYIYGNRKLVQEIGKHMKLGTVKREGNEAVLQHECAKGRITLASNGDAVAVDGTEGDLLIYTDIPLYLMKANEQLDGFEMSCLGVGVVPCYWQSHTAKKLAPFAMSPFYTVTAKLESDERSCYHCIINDTVQGSFSQPNGLLKDVFRTDGGGFPTYGQSGIMSMTNAQAKNADANTNYPYMGNYYEFYELWITMMYAECGTLDTTDLYCMGTGCTQQEVVNESTWNNDRIAANSGVKIFSADGTVVNYGGLMSQSLKKGADGTDAYNLDSLVGSAYYVFTKNGEALTVLDGITKGGLQAKVGNSGCIFHCDASGNLVCTDDGSIDLTTGTGMEAAKRYYIVRDVPNCQGIADGVMTAVVNCYVKMNIADGVYNKTTDLTGGYIIYKFSHSLYRGLSIPMDGMFRQLCGAYYTVSNENGEFVNKFYCAEKCQDLPPLVEKTCYTDVANADNLDITRGLSYKKSVPGSTSWVGTADYGTSLFCFTVFDGSSHKKEVCYTWNDSYCIGQGKGGYPEEGKFCVKNLSVGCVSFYGFASARSGICNYAANNGSYTAGAFSVPQLKLK